MVGHLHGGLGLAGVMACALFAAVSGSSPATEVAIGSILLPAMVKAGFPKRFGAGVITTSGALGILIPPSVVMVMFSVATNTSVGALFMAGVIPGLILATMLGLTTWYLARKHNYPRVMLALLPGVATLQATIGSMFMRLLCADVFHCTLPSPSAKSLLTLWLDGGLPCMCCIDAVVVRADSMDDAQRVGDAYRPYIGLIPVVGIPVYASILALGAFDVSSMGSAVCDHRPHHARLGHASIQACGKYTKIAPTFRFELMWESRGVLR